MPTPLYSNSITHAAAVTVAPIVVQILAAGNYVVTSVAITIDNINTSAGIDTLSFKLLSGAAPFFITMCSQAAGAAPPKLIFPMSLYPGLAFTRGNTMSYSLNSNFAVINFVTFAINIYGDNVS